MDLLSLKKKADLIVRALLQANPSPIIELNYNNDFTLLIAVVLSAQSTDKHVNKVTGDLFKDISTPEDVVSRGLEWLRGAISSINYYNTKASNIFKTSQILVERFDSKVPDNLSDLLSLPGVGQKSASVLLNCLFKQDLIPVDTHVFRVSHRLGIAKAPTREKVQTELESIINKNKAEAHHLLVLHGRYVCKAQKPLCDQCIIREYCTFYAEKTQKTS